MIVHIEMSEDLLTFLNLDKHLAKSSYLGLT
jgi:hypothetical protein